MTIFAEGRERNAALGIWGAASGSRAAVGVLLGGVLTSCFSWQWIFFIDAPVGAVVLLLTPRVLRARDVRSGLRHFDLPGALSATGAVMVLVYGLTVATDQGFGDRIALALFAASALLAVAFVAIERRAPVPLLPLRMFRIRTFSVGNAITTIVASIAFSEFFLLTLYPGRSPLLAGSDRARVLGGRGDDRGGLERRRVTRHALRPKAGADRRAAPAHGLARADRTTPGARPVRPRPGGGRSC